MHLRFMSAAHSPLTGMFHATTVALTAWYLNLTMTIVIVFFERQDPMGLIVGMNSLITA